MLPVSTMFIPHPREAETPWGSFLISLLPFSSTVYTCKPPSYFTTTATSAGKKQVYRERDMFLNAEQFILNSGLEFLIPNVQSTYTITILNNSNNS